MEQVISLTLKGIQDTIILNNIEYTISNKGDNYEAIIKKGDTELIILKNMADSLKNNHSKKLIESYPNQLKTIHFTRYIFDRMRLNGMITEIPEFADTIITQNQFNLKKTNNMRHFIVFYNALDKNKNTISSFTASTTPNGYIRNKTYCEYIEKERDFSTVQITNIIELNESDFKDFLSHD